MDLKRLYGQQAVCRLSQPESAQFTSDTTEDLPDVEATVGQDRARTAVNFGRGIWRPGYNPLMIVR